MDNQRLFLYIGLAMVVYLLWQAWVEQYGQKPPAKVASPVEQRIIPQDAPQTPSVSPATDIPQATEIKPLETTTQQPNELPAPEPEGELIRVTTDVFNLDISTRGGDIVRADLVTYPVSVTQEDKPFPLLDEVHKRYSAQTGLIHDKTEASSKRLTDLAPNHYAKFQADQSEYALDEGEDSIRVTLHWQGPTGIRVDKIYIFHRGDFQIQIQQIITNQSDQIWTGRQYRQLRHGPVRDEDTQRFIYTFTGTAYFDGKYNKLAFDDMGEEPLQKELKGGWVAILQHYFVSAFTPDSSSVNNAYSNVFKGTSGPEYIIGLNSEPQSAAPGESVEFSSKLFVGPKLQNRLADIAEGLDLTTDYGILTFISKPLFWLLDKIHATIGNWGWSIIILTMMIKLVFYKLSETSYKSMARMRKMAPRMTSLKERYGDDKQRYQQAMMDLYKKEKINPLGGCLPILVQIPVFIALYWALLESVELRQAPFMFWIQDLSVKDQYFVLPLLMGITMFAQQKLNPPPPDPMQAKVMSILPVVFTVFFAFFPAGLVLYWFVNNLLSILQQWVITKRIEQQPT